MPKFQDYPQFRPNLTPRQIFKMGSFGGTYWRPIHSHVTGKDYEDQHLEFDFLKNIPTHYLTQQKCDKTINKYRANSGSSLEDWEDKGWIKEQDPYGWVQWYCRFYRGRRTEDDQRQIKRWLSFAGPSGRFRKRLINMCKQKGKDYDDYSVSPVIRQGLQHWGYKLTKEDFI